MKRRDFRCAFCGKKVKAAHGFFRSWPDPIALHHECVRPYSASGGRVTAGKKGQAEVRWSAELP